MRSGSTNTGHLPVLLVLSIAITLGCSGEESELQQAASAPAAAGERSALVVPDSSTAAGSAFLAGLKHADESRYDSALARLNRASELYLEAEDWRMYVAAANRVGANLSATGSYEEAAERLEGVLETGRRELAADDPLIGETLYNLGLNSRRYGDLDGAATYLTEALSVHRSAFGDRHPEVAEVYNELGTVHRIEGDYERAIAFHELAGSIFRSSLGAEAPEVAESYNDLAITHAIKGDYDKALESFREALSILRSRLGDGHARTANAYNNIGIVHAFRGDYEQAIAFFNNALSIYRATVGEGTLEAGNTHDNLGEVYHLTGDYERAAEYHGRALEIRRDAFGEHNIQVSTSYQNLAGDHWEQDDLAAALDYADRALALRLELVGDSHPLVAETYLRLGGIRRDAGDSEGAVAAYENALAILRANFGRHHPDLAEVYNQLAGTRAEQGELGLALEMVQGAIRANIPTLLDDDLAAEPPLNGVLSDEKLLTSLRQKADLLRSRYAASSSVDDLRASLASYRHATRLMDQMRRGYRAGGSKLLLAERVSDLYERAIETALQLHRLTGADEAREAAFFFSEKSKAGILLEAFTELEARRIAGIPDSLLERERQVQVDLAAYRNSLAQERLRGAGADSAKIALWEGTILELEGESERLLAQFERDYRSYHDLKYRFEIAPVSQIQAELLGDGRVLLEYFVGSDSVYIFTIDEAGLTVLARSKGAELEDRVSRLRAGIVDRDYRAYSGAAFALYETLVRPVEEKLGDRLLIVPDGALNYVPFEALLSEAAPRDPDVVDYRVPAYLLRRHTTTYAYSATLALETRRRHRPPADRDFLAYAPVFEGGIAGDSRGARFIQASRGTDATRAAPGAYLPATRDEVTAVEQLFADRQGLLARWLGGKTEVHLGDRASESNLKESDLEDYRYLHFATHGFTNEDEPALSGLLLAASDGGEDGVLHLSEIYNLRLNAELVVLSACETGVGRLARGEGLLGLTRGFLYAGAANLLVSLWQVNDASTSSLMVDFYATLLEGEPKAAALREAKLRMLETPRDADPYGWAPFILIGS